MQVSRRELFKYAAAGTAAAGLAALAGPSVANAGPATLIDYSAGVPSPLGIRAAGHVGAIRYVSDRRPGAEWMSASPCSSVRPRPWRRSACRSSPATVRQGADVGLARRLRRRHPPRATRTGVAPGCRRPENCPIYASIDDNPSPWEFDNLIAPYLRGWEEVLGRRNVGVYANTPTIDRCLRARDRGTVLAAQLGIPGRLRASAAHLHQFEIDKRRSRASASTSTRSSSRSTVNGRRRSRSSCHSRGIDPGRIHPTMDCGRGIVRPPDT